MAAAEYFVPSKLGDGGAAVPDRLSGVRAGSHRHCGEVFGRTGKIRRPGHSTAAKIFGNDPYATAGEVASETAHLLLLEHRRLVPGRLDHRLSYSADDRAGACEKQVDISGLSHLVSLVCGRATVKSFGRPVALPRQEGPWRDDGHDAACYLKILTARAMTRATVSNATAACRSMSIFAHREKGMTSVGLKAVAFVNDKYR